MNLSHKKPYSVVKNSYQNWVLLLGGFAEESYKGSWRPLDVIIPTAKYLHSGHRKEQMNPIVYIIPKKYMWVKAKLS